jgi:hypothetical protein
VIDPRHPGSNVGVVYPLLDALIAGTVPAKPVDSKPVEAKAVTAKAGASEIK